MSPTCPGRTCDDPAAVLVHPPQATLNYSESSVHGSCTIAEGAHPSAEDAWNLSMTLACLSTVNVIFVLVL